MRTTFPIVSVAIVTYNQKDFLREAIESVLSQNFSDIEIVIGDDGSDDGTQDMLKEYLKKYPGKFILILSEQNCGITQNSNKVHFACNGKYIAWLGGDDLMLPGKLEKQVVFMEKNSACNLIYHNLEVFESSTGEVLNLYTSQKDKYTGTVEKLIRYGTFNGACSTMVRRSASPVHGYDLKLPVAGDWFYWIEHLVKGGTIEFIDEVLGKYRRHSNNVSSATSPLSKQGIADFFTTCQLIIDKYPKYKKEIRLRKSEFYRGIRRNSYQNLLTSLNINPFNVKSLLILSIYLITFKKVKL